MRQPPRYSKHSSGRARVRIDGKVHYLPGPYGSEESRDAYGKLLAQWLEDQQQTSRAPTVRLTLNKLSVVYLQHCRQHYRKGGVETSEVNGNRIALRHVSKVCGKTPVADLTPRLFKSVRQSMIDAGYVRTSINRHMGRIRRMLKWGVAEGLVPLNVYLAAGTLAGLQADRCDAVESEPVKPVPAASVDAVLQHVSRPVRGIIEFMRATGARPSEAMTIRGCDVNMTGPVWEYTPQTHKTVHHGKRRIVMIGPAGQRLLREYLKPETTAYLFDPRDAVADLVRRQYRKGAKVRSCGERYTLNSLAAAIRRACIKAEVPLWSANQLRHLFGTLARRAGGIEAARVVLGHASAAVSEIYAERDLDAARQIVAKIG